MSKTIYERLEYLRKIAEKIRVMSKEESEARIIFEDYEKSGKLKTALLIAKNLFYDEEQLFKAQLKSAGKTPVDIAKELEVLHV